jgi:hypothetical protein
LRVPSAAVGIPGVKPRPWYVKDTWPAAAALIAGVVASGAALWKESAATTPSKLQLSALVVAAASVVFLGVVKIAQSLFKDAHEDKKQSPEELRGCLLVIHRSVAGKKEENNPPEGWLRLTLHRVVGDELEQSVEYVGSEDREMAGRRFSINAGLIGAVARTGETRAVHRDPEMPFFDWCEYLVADHGMTREAARGTRADRFSFLGVPIKSVGGREVRAVVYLDAAEAGFFDNEIASLIVTGCAGLAAWIDEQYYN